MHEINKNSLEHLEETNAVINAAIQTLLAEVREETIPKAPAATEGNEATECVIDEYEVLANLLLDKQILVSVPGAVEAVEATEATEVATTKPKREPYIYKIRIQSNKSGISYSFACNELERDAKVAYYESDDNVKRIEVFDYVESEPSRNVPAPLQSKIKQVVSIAPSYFAKPYSIAQIDLRDKIQIANFARQILVDPAESDLWKPIGEMNHEELLAKVEFHKAQYDLAIEFAKRANLLSNAEKVKEIREDQVSHAKKIRNQKELKAKTGTPSEVEKKSKKLARDMAVSTKHRMLLQFVAVMGLDIPNYSALPEKELEIEVAKLKSEMMGKK